jgi:cephalosporin-C deacetylase-like acetyl esterase
LLHGKLYQYYWFGIGSRKTYYFRQAILGCLRAVDYLSQRPDWDRKHLIVQGSSQGGGLALATAGLDKRVTAVAADIPAFCDQNGGLYNRPRGWPKMVATEIPSRIDPKQLKIAQYYDGVNFARRITIPAIMETGLRDNLCPAMTCLSAYNVLRGPKQIVIEPLMDHNTFDRYKALLREFVLEQGGLQRK